MSFSELKNNKALNVLGLMSGTSVDGLDMALCRIAQKGKGYDIKVYQTGFKKFPTGLRNLVIQIASSDVINKSNLVALENRLCEFYSDSIKTFMKICKGRRIDLIGSHGQTIYHCDPRLSLKASNSRGTWQIGDGGRIAAQTGIPVVSDFRVNDVALGGSGAPLTPVCHYHLFGQKRKNIAVLNIGGIANLTFLPGKGGIKSIQASDCGPGNMLVDGLMQRLYNKKYDRNGKNAMSGDISTELLSYLKHFQWFKKPFPKSLGREQYGTKMIDGIMKQSNKYKLAKADIVATAAEFTIISVLKYISTLDRIDNLITCGGGVHNRYFMNGFSDKFDDTDVYCSLEYSFDPDYIEAVSFALLASMFINNDPANLPFVTGATGSTALGKLSLP